MAGESSISLGGIEERAAALEVAQKAEAAKPAAETPATEKKSETPAPEAKAPAIVPGMAPVTQTEDKKAPNDPEELRKWNTKVSMELAEVRKQNIETQKQLQTLAETLNKTSRKQVDWKDLAKDPVKLQAAIEEQRKQDASEYEQKYTKADFEHKSRVTKLENQRRMHDPMYPRWAELNPAIVEMAVKGDSRVDFSKDPVEVLDQMYELAQQAKPVAEKPAAAPAPVVKTYTDADLAAAREEARKEALAEAQKGLANEAKGAGVAGMGKGAPKGKGGVDKDALWNMPMKDLKSMIQKASE